MILFCCCLFYRQFVEQQANLHQHLIRLGLRERIFQHPLRSKLCAAFGILGNQFHQAAWIDACLLGEAKVQLIALAIYLRHAYTLAFRAQKRGFEKELHPFRHGAVTIFELRLHIGDCAFGLCSSNAYL